MSSYGKVSLFLKKNINFVLSFLEMQIRFIIQTKLYYKFFYCLKKKSHKPSKVAAANFFPGVYVIGTTCFDERFYSM